MLQNEIKKPHKSKRLNFLVTCWVEVAISEGRYILTPIIQCMY